MEEKNKKWIWIGAGVAILVIGGVIIYRRNKKIAEKKKQEELQKNARPRVAYQKPQNKANEPVFKEAAQEERSNVFPLGFGAKGYEVAVIQQYMNSTCKASLKAAGTDPLEVTGIWDEETQASIETCSSLKRKEVDEDTYKRIYRDMEAAGILPEHE